MAVDLERESVIGAFDALGSAVGEYLACADDDRRRRFPLLAAAVAEAERRNAWFCAPFVHNALAAIRPWLRADALNPWLAAYPWPSGGPRRVGVVMAGNLPLVGFHDFLSVLAAGHRVVAKLSSRDDVLLPALSRILRQAEPRLAGRISFVGQLPPDIDALLASGSDSTMRDLGHGFYGKPQILRGSRSSAAVLAGDESPGQLDSLADDICLYFGQGCRSVAKLFVASEAVLAPLAEALRRYAWMTRNAAWASNLRFQRALMLTRRQPFVDAGAVLLAADAGLSSPLGVVHYEVYPSLPDLRARLAAQADRLQCVVGSPSAGAAWVPFGQAQSPALADYADGVDTLAFLSGSV